MSERESIEFVIKNAGRVWKTRESQTRERLAEALGSLLSMVERGDLRIKEGGSGPVKAPTPKRYISMEDIRKLSVQEFVDSAEDMGSFPTVTLEGRDYSFGVKYLSRKPPLLFATCGNNAISISLDAEDMTMDYVLERFSIITLHDERF